ncbi:PucR family transcriptional regulator [Aquibacillus albus]|uniref:Purine catabolism regulator n=1 Tax=Aquibacillus albus TaxID=1168171 RepID=A0ABS2MZ29_9BACI|nr:PucR family transcriptional regulator [Aquibacillus albus]MBM7571120.1 purine catabolism regulator [Aquibacillus albus]
MKVAEVLQIDALKNCQIVAGHLGLNREVLHVNMMDAPDIISFLKENELLVTTAYHLKDQPHLLIDLVKAMDKQGCAALGIKTKRFLQEIPSDVLELADKLSFPIIELSIDTSLGDIVNHTLNCILDKRTNELQHAIDIHKQFTNHIMSGKGINQLIKRLSSLVGYPVILIDQYAKPIFYSEFQDSYIQQMEVWQKSDIHFYFPDTAVFQFSDRQTKQTYSVFSVYTHQKRAGFLVLVGEVLPIDHSTTLTIEQATNVISFELMKEHALKQYDRRVRNEFFFNFVEGAFSSEEEIVSRAKEFSLENEQTYLCIAGKLVEGDPFDSYVKNQRKNESIFEYIEDELKVFPVRTHFFTKGDGCFLLMKITDASQINSPVIPALEQIQSKIRRQFNTSISFGLSNISTNLLHVKNAYKEAKDSLQAGLLSGKENFIQSYRTKGIMELLRIIPVEDLKDFYQHALNQLASLEFKEDKALLQTLFVYLESHCQISETAKRLYVHRNTVVYRLEKCEELLGRKLHDPETTLQLRIALQIKTILQL